MNLFDMGFRKITCVCWLSVFPRQLQVSSFFTSSSSSSSFLIQAAVIFQEQGSSLTHNYISRKSCVMRAAALEWRRNSCYCFFDKPLDDADDDDNNLASFHINQSLLTVTSFDGYRIPRNWQSSNFLVCGIWSVFEFRAWNVAPVKCNRPLACLG